MRDCEKILDQKLGSREFAEAFEATSMEYDFIDRIAAACAKLSKAEKGENWFPAYIAIKVRPLYIIVQGPYFYLFFFLIG